MFFFLEREAPFPESLRAYGIHLISVIGWMWKAKDTEDSRKLFRLLARRLGREREHRERSRFGSSRGVWSWLVDSLCEWIMSLERVCTVNGRLRLEL